MSGQKFKPVWEQVGLFCDDFWTWDCNNRSYDVILDGTNNHRALFHRYFSTNTAGVRGTRILNNGRFFWELEVLESRGTSIMIGIGTENTVLHQNTFGHLLGQDDQSWGLSHHGLIFHKGICARYCGRFHPEVPTIIGVLFDGKSGTLSYYKNWKPLGVAFRGLNSVKEPLYPIISSTAAKTRMVLLQRKREFFNLQDRCRASIVERLNFKEDVNQLRIPSTLKAFLCESMENR
ncbi:hypothetical protein YQE_07148, partial [Dendroctonus ponderosae]